MGVLRNARFGAVVSKWLVRDSVSGETPPALAVTDDPTFVLFGGELYNKGAQAMTYTVVDALRRRYPDCTIVLMSTKEYKSERDPQYRFQVLPWDEDLKLQFLRDERNESIDSPHDERPVESVHSTLEESDAIFDISGYSISSQLGLKTSISYIIDIIIARKYEVPYYILPQSIGPFDYGLPGALLTGPMFRTYLPYVSLICPREPAGVSAVEKYTTGNVQLERDLVLQRPEYNLENIASDIETTVPDIEREAVGVIPNENVVAHAAESNIVDLYREMIRSISSERPVYILRHAVGDEELCKDLYDPFADSKNVYLMNSEFNAVQLEEIIATFEYVIASRYHSLVHAYRSGVPAIVLSWAEKYAELCKYFDQEEFVFDVREGIALEPVLDAVETMERTYESEQEHIASVFGALNDEPFLIDRIFDVANAQSGQSNE